MQLKYLWVDGFKNLKNAEFQFPESYSAIIGTNGSGKSNFIEVLAYLFSALYESPIPKIDFNCKLHYEIDGKVIKFIRAAGYTNMTLDECDISFEEYTKEPLRYLPQEVISLYSGDEKRLYKNYFSKWEDKYNKSNRGQESIQDLKMIYVSSKQWDIFAFLLNVYNSSEEDANLLKDIGCCGIKRIEIDFNIDNLKNNSNSLVKSILEILNPKSDKNVKWKDEYDIKLLLDHLNAFGASELYANLNLCFNPDYIIIERFDIIFDSGFDVEKMSEGNKKLILLNGIYKFLVGQNSLVLLDEPDTYLHESRKRDIIDVFSKYGFGYTVLTTHSSVLISKSNADNITMVVQSTEGVQVRNNENLKELLNAVGDSATITTINGIIESSKPVLMLEGQDDVNYFNKALSIFSRKDAKYKSIACDVISFNGAGNARAFVNNFLKFMPDRKIICVFDRDDSGKEGLAAVLGVDKETIKMDLNVHSFGNIKLFMYPPAYNKPADKWFLVEDYFKDDFILSEVKRWAEVGIKSRYRSEAKIEKRVKDYIRDEFKDDSIAESDFEGFGVLLDKLLNVLNNNSVAGNE